MLAIRRAKSAWNSTCEIVVCGDDREQLEAVAEAASNELDRWEKKLSLSNPQSDLNRINRSAGRDEVAVDQELVDLLQFCLDNWRNTGGWFDVSARTLTDELLTASVALTAPSREPYSIHPIQRTVRLSHPNTIIDLNGIGRAYALDRTIELIRRYGIANAQVRVGDGTHFSMGQTEAGQPWEVSLTDPFRDNAAREFAKVWPREQGTSWTATLFARDPVAKTDLTTKPGDPSGEGARSLAVFVMAPSAALAQAWSIAGLHMAEKRWHRYLDYWTAQGLCFGWSTVRSDRAGIQWLTLPPASAI